MDNLEDKINELNKILFNIKKESLDLVKIKKIQFVHNNLKECIENEMLSGSFSSDQKKRLVKIFGDIESEINKKIKIINN